MNQKRIYNLDVKEWLPIREDITSLVYGKSLLPKDWTNVTISLTKVSPEGQFKNHIDSYHHVFYFIQGNGIGFINDEEYKIKSGVVVEIPAGTNHSYRNIGNEDLILLTINIPI